MEELSTRLPCDIFQHMLGVHPPCEESGDDFYCLMLDLSSRCSFKSLVSFPIGISMHSD